MKKYIFLFLAVVTLTSCQPSREKLNGRISAMENRLFAPSAQAISKESADSLISEYELFVKEFPKDSLAPAYLFKAAGMSMNTGDGPRAITFFDRVVKEYPAHPKAALALFFKGYVLENILRDLGQAKETYLLFLEKYPDNEFADDAKASIENLGKTPEQMIREFEAKSRADSAVAQKKTK
jgi:outer membrane protein assembly factor BamD (BamD/ComL family)